MTRDWLNLRPPPLIFLGSSLMSLCQKYRERKGLQRAFLVDFKFPWSRAETGQEAHWFELRGYRTQTDSSTFERAVPPFEGNINRTKCRLNQVYLCHVYDIEQLQIIASIPAPLTLSGDSPSPSLVSPTGAVGHLQLHRRRRRN